MRLILLLKEIITLDIERFVTDMLQYAFRSDSMKLIFVCYVVRLLYIYIYIYIYMYLVYI